LIDQLAKEAQRDERKKKEERNNNERSNDDYGGKVSPSSFFVSQLGELVAAAKNKERKDPCVALHLQRCRILSARR
jgi:hypothetical protein